MNRQIFAQQVKQSLNKEYGIDPFTILTIISAIIQISKFIYECLEKNQSYELISQRPLLARLLIRRAIKSKLSSKDYKEYGSILEEVILKEAKTLNKNEYNQILGELNVIN